MPTEFDIQRYLTGFQFKSLPNGWNIGCFSALEELGLPHAVTTFNGPDVQNIKTHTFRAATQLAGSLGLKGAAFLDQIHGGQALPTNQRGLAGSADALHTNTQDLCLCGKSADCPLILIVDPRQLAIGFAHASWRSTVAGITTHLVQSMHQTYQCQPEELIACLCPSIAPQCYEVGPEVRQAAVNALGPHAHGFFNIKDEKDYFDLWHANIDALQRCGVLANHIQLAGLCNHCEPYRFPSYRAEGQRAGRFFAAIGLPPA